MAEAEVEDFGLDVLGAGRVDGFSQLLDKQLDEFGAGALEVLPKGLGRDLGAGDFAELGGDLLDRGLGEVAPQLQDGGVAILGGLTPDRFRGATRRG